MKESAPKMSEILTERLLTYLIQDQKAINSATLANHFGKSSRTIKSQVKAINDSLPEAILSSRQGYRINPLKIEEIQTHFKLNTQNYQFRASEREKMILLTLLKNQEAVNVYDLSMAMYLSESTLRSEIKKLNSRIENFGVKIIAAGDDYKLIGDEVDKRRIYLNQVYSDVAIGHLSEAMLTELFENLNVPAIAAALREALQEENYFIDDYVFISTLLHIALILERSFAHIQINSRQLDIDKNEMIFALSQRFSDKLKQQLHISLSKAEQTEVYLLLLAKMVTVISNTSDLQALIKNMTSETKHLVPRIIQVLVDDYGLDTQKTNLLAPFFFHLDHLFLQIQVNYYMRNPILKGIKSGSPFIYDVAVSVTNIINQYFNIRLPEDETGFIALHLSVLLTANHRKRKIATVLISPTTSNMQLQLKANIDHLYSDRLMIQHVLRDEQALQQLSAPDLILTTVHLQNDWQHAVNITPFLNQDDQHKIAEQIDHLEMQQKYLAFETLLSKFTDDTLYMTNTVLSHRHEVFDVVSDILENKGYVNSLFKDDLYHRESLSSTAFGRIAIPHTFKLTAIQSKVYIIVSEKPIHWEKQHYVNLIFVFAINHQDKEHFYTFYETLAYIFSNLAHFDDIVKQPDLKHFTQFLLDKIR